MKKLISVVLVLGSCVAVACSSSSDDSGGSAGSSNGTGGSGAGRTGITPCGNFPDQVAKSCQASQYCQDEGFSKCAAGCLSDNNCTENQTCIKAGGANEGTCQTKPSGGGGSGTGGSGTGGATGGSACDGTAFADTCKLCSLSPMCADPAFCKQLGEPCASCVVAATPGGCNTVAMLCKAQCGL